MKRTEVDIFYNKSKGYIFASKTKYLGRVTHGVVNPVLKLSIDKADEEAIGEYLRKALDISKTAEPIDKDAVGVYEYWIESGEKTYSSFGKNHVVVEIEEIDDKLLYQKYYYIRGGYIASCKAEERKSISISVSNKELGEFVKNQINSFIGYDFGKFPGRKQYIWDGTSWVKKEHQ